MTTVVNIKDGVPPNSVYIGRARPGLPGYFGNPARTIENDMRDWEISSRVIELGHVISTRRAGFTSQRCGRTFSDILKGGLRCSKARVL